MFHHHSSGGDSINTLISLKTPGREDKTIISQILSTFNQTSAISGIIRNNFLQSVTLRHNPGYLYRTQNTYQERDSSVKTTICEKNTKQKPGFKELGPLAIPPGQAKKPTHPVQLQLS